MSVLIFHPGDLSLWELAGLIGVVLALTVLPISIIAFVIYKVIRTHSSREDGKPTTLDLNKNR